MKQSYKSCVRIVLCIAFSLPAFLSARQVFRGENLWKLQQQVTEASCDATITQDNFLADKLTISNAGVYCLAESVNGHITIASDGVTLDLNGKKISGVGQDLGPNDTILTSSQTDITIKNGIVTGDENILNCISVDNATNVTISDVDFMGTDTGVYVSTSTCVTIDHCTFREHTSEAICFGDVYASSILRSTFKRNTAINIINLQNSSCITAQNLDICENSRNGSAIGILCDNVSNSQLIDCVGNNNQSQGEASNYDMFLLLNCNSIFFLRCQAVGNSAGEELRGFGVFSSIGIVFNSCIASDNNATNDNVYGIRVIITSSLCTVKNCIAKNNAAGLISRGIVNNGSSNVFINNESQGHDTNFDGPMPIALFEPSGGSFIDTPCPCPFDNIDVLP